MKHRPYGVTYGNQQGKRIPQLFRQKSTNTDNNTPSKETADLKFKVNFFTLDL